MARAAILLAMARLSDAALTPQTFVSRASTRAISDLSTRISSGVYGSTRCSTEALPAISVVFAILVLLRAITPRVRISSTSISRSGDDANLHITDKERTIRTDEKQVLTVYSSMGTPVMTINGDTVACQNVARTVYRTDTLRLNGKNDVRVSVGDRSDEMTLTIGNYLRVQ